MKVKRNLLSAAVASTLLASGAAQAVHLSETGLGQVLLFPYYSVRSVDGNAFNTYIHLVNTTNAPKAVKVRFREGKNSREVLDFNLYLSAKDVWVGSVEPTTDGAKIVAYDNSCTAPAIPAAGQEFRNYRFANTTLGNQEDGAGTSLDRTREGYIEVIEMGVPVTFKLKDGEDFVDAITHGSDGVPGSCASVIDSWKGTDNVGTGAHFNTSTAELTNASGGLAGSSVLINVGSGTAYSNEPTVLDAFWDPTLINGTHNYPGTELPALTDVDPNSQIYGGGSSVIASTWSNSLYPADAVSAVLMRDAVINEYTVNPATAAKTDWVVTFPTKKYYVDAKAAARPFTEKWAGETGACESVSMQYWDREEATYSPGGGIDFSPQLPGAAGPALCWETNVITFKTSDAADAYTGVFGSKVQADLKLAAGFNRGWMNLTFTEANAANELVAAGTTMMDDAGSSYFGLPVIGFAARSVTNGAVAAGVLSNYGSEQLHKYTRDVVVAP